MSLALLTALALTGTPRLPYGGTLLALTAGDPIALDPSALATLADLTLAEAVYEPLYAVGPDGALVPILAAELPACAGDTCTLRLRPNLRLHDGRALTAEDAAASLRRLAQPGSPGAFVVLPVEGARARLAGDASVPLGIEAAGDQLVLRLAQPYPDLARLLASPRAAIVAGAGRGPALLGTGPFLVADTRGPRHDQVDLAPFPGHREGRPFIDGVRLRPADSGLTAKARLRRGEAALVLGLPDSTEPDPIRDEPRHPALLFVLAIGNQSQALRDRGLERAIDRGRLAHRFLGAGGRASSTLLDVDRSSEPPDADPREKPKDTLRVSLLVPVDHSPAARMAERVQLDLLRAGVSAIIQHAGAEAMDAKRRSGDYELMIDTAFVEARPIDDAADKLHGLLALASRYAATGLAVSSAELAAFAKEPEAARLARVRAIDAALRSRAGLVPLAVAPVPVLIGARATGIARSASGAPRLEDARLARP